MSGCNDEIVIFITLRIVFIEISKVWMIILIITDELIIQTKNVVVFDLIFGKIWIYYHYYSRCSSHSCWQWNIIPRYSQIGENVVQLSGYKNDTRSLAFAFSEFEKYIFTGQDIL
jgi:hypothetical protein